MSSSALFGGFVLAATAIEATERTKQAPSKSALFQEFRFGFLSPVQTTLLSRVRVEDRAKVDQELTAAGFNSQQLDLAARWARGEVNFIRHHGKRSK